jgi:DNA-binding response OmpR family regulator
MPATPTGAPRSLLLIEDDQELVDLLVLHLQSEGFVVATAGDGPAGLELHAARPFAAVILDWMLPSLQGIDVLRAIRERDDRTPVLMLTARGEEADKILGLELGCDDYMTKPFSMGELAARIKALLRRVERAEELARETAGGRIIELGPLRLDHDKRKVEIQGRPVQLTVKEYDLLHTLASRPGRTFSRRQLLDLVWDQAADIYEHTVNSHINRLRNKIEANPNRPQLILTVWGIGYRFTEDHL